MFRKFAIFAFFTNYCRLNIKLSETVNHTKYFYIVYAVIEVTIHSLQQILHSMTVGYSASLRMRLDVQRACTFRVKHFRGFLFALSRNNTTEIVVQRGSARYIIHIRPESHIGFWSSGYDGFWRVTSLSRFIPRTLSRHRSVYCYVAFMHEPSRFYCHVHMNYAGRKGTLRAFWAEVGGGVNGGGGYWGKRKSMARLCLPGSARLADSWKPNYRFSRVFNYTLDAQTFQRMFNPPAFLLITRTFVSVLWNLSFVIDGYMKRKY